MTGYLTELLTPTGWRRSKPNLKRDSALDLDLSLYMQRRRRNLACIEMRCFWNRAVGLDGRQMRALDGNA